MKYLTAFLFTILVLICTVAVIQYGDENVHPKSTLLESYTINGDYLTFQINNLEGTYTIDLPDSVTINKNDEVKLSYELRNNKIIEIEEIIINNKSAWDVSDPNRIDIKRT